ncbi:MAG TPA: DnaJ domain-containing protein, partial [Acidimicrobiia bacterium]
MAPQREWFEKDYYTVLGLQKGATEKDITRAYRKLAKQYHPDANQGNKEAEERFKNISAAYDVLGDAAKRKEYDEVRAMGANPFAGAGAGGFNAGDFGDGNIRFETGDMGGLGDLLGNIFGRAGRRQTNRQPGAGPRRGGDLEAEVHLAFDDAVRGATIAVQLTGAAPCHTCGGTGAAPGTVPTTCPPCNGTGTLAVDQGPFSFSQICPRCGGSGRVVETPCPTCHGSGSETRTREVKV